VVYTDIEKNLLSACATTFYMPLSKLVGVRVSAEQNRKLEALAKHLSQVKSKLIREAVEYVIRKWERKHGPL
jgi:hypothetical protein